ncbi:hypothetical protein [Microbacterium sp. NPDC086615]|uniref:hypothetical protein n=1 Tax=Microbacterium sp. NPDC086615 TaxID=3154865 RepID=UPI003435935D
MPADETYSTTVELPGVGDVQVIVRVFRGHQGGRVVRQSIIEGTYPDGGPLTPTDRVLALTLLPAVD